LAIVYLGVGSNVGNRKENILKAAGLLENRNIHILKQSSLRETDPVGGPPQGLFLNGALKVKTDLSPRDLLKKLKSIENEIGRRKTVYHGPRVIDLDILLYDDVTVNTNDLVIPHPRMYQRDFVLIPLKEIASELLEKSSNA